MRPPLHVGCIVDDCDRKHLARGYCNVHYKQLVVRGGSTRGNPLFHLEDVEWMAETGESWIGALDRLGVKEDTLLRRLERADRYDLIRKLKGRVAA